MFRFAVSRTLRATTGLNARSFSRTAATANEGLNFELSDDLRVSWKEVVALVGSVKLWEGLGTVALAFYSFLNHFIAIMWLIVFCLLHCFIISSCKNPRISPCMFAGFG